MALELMFQLPNLLPDGVRVAAVKLYETEASYATVTG